MATHRFDLDFHFDLDLGPISNKSGHNPEFRNGDWMASVLRACIPVSL
jgi:hypothetical protein